MSLCPPYAPFFGFAGVASAMVLSTVGAAVRDCKSRNRHRWSWTFKPELIMKSLIPVVMSGIIAVYGLVVSVLISSPSHPPPTPSSRLRPSRSRPRMRLHRPHGRIRHRRRRRQLRARYVHESKVFVSMVLILIFAEVLEIVWTNCGTYYEL
ncbi:hypothetical protein BDZ89DRAFT_1124716 [Hymenopellis radicata]|nr:hypothetical protein BDZ89DRAFT_1124716 [Hymenopellis radicata]